MYIGCRIQTILKVKLNKSRTLVYQFSFLKNFKSVYIAQIIVLFVKIFYKSVSTIETAYVCLKQVFPVPPPPPMSFYLCMNEVD